MRFNISFFTSLKLVSFAIIGLFSYSSMGSQYFVQLSSGVKLALDESYVEHDLISLSTDVSFGGKIADNVDFNLSYQFQERIKRNDNKVIIDTKTTNLDLNYKIYERDTFAFYSGLGLSYWNIDKEDHIKGTIADKGFSPTLSLAFNYHLIDDFEFVLLYRYIYGIGNGHTGKYDENGLYIGFKYYLNKGFGVVGSSRNYFKEEEVGEREVGESFDVEDIESDRVVVLPFEINSSLLRPLVEIQLIDTYKYIVDNNISKVFIAGHTDDTGNELYNKKLSLERANNVRDYLNKLGVSLELMTIEAKGSSEPGYSNKEPNGRKENRRVVISY
ncbi:OmpA family protein [Vibrio cholerae]|uniref:OmpA family protein n=1 Tax=Vibrio cholerae TaxID=666 RepID=UPI003966FE44